jgi:beta-mannosidase
LAQAPADAPVERATWQEFEEIAQWLPAQVPGNVRADLVRAGHLPELTLAHGAEAAQWVDSHCWWLAREFPRPAEPGRRVHAILRGVDYVSDLFLNGVYLGRHEGMFSPLVQDITTLLRTENVLAIRLLGSRWLPQNRSSRSEKFWNQLEAILGNLPSRFPHRRDTLKCQMGFGWDFAPPLRSMGIWDDVYLVVSDQVLIEDISFEQDVTPLSAVVTVDVQVDSTQESQVELRLILTGETFETHPLAVKQPIHLLKGPSLHRLTLAIPDPKLWWPWDHGHPHLYRLSVEVWRKDQLLDSDSILIGIRDLDLEDWTVRVNGHRIYSRGANWVPADILPGRVSGTDYKNLVTLARQANMNMLRVWGGGLREKRAFYEACDRLGILVWQEFPFACAFLTRFPRSQSYMELVESEARSIVRELRNHPCLAIWCGGNEFSPSRNEALTATLRHVVEEKDPRRPFLPVSPAAGDSHNWLVWHEFYPPSHFRFDRSPFASELGLQSPPEARALRRFIPDDELWPPGPSWTYHGAELSKLWRYARPYLRGVEPTLELFVKACQRAQSRGLQIAIEHYRRRKAQGCGGVLVWQLNEPWPAISWALLDYYRQPKPAYEVVKRLFEPVLVSIEYPLLDYEPGNRLYAKVWIINDSGEELAGCHLEIILQDGDQQPAERIQLLVDIEADSARIVGSLNWPLPAGGGWRLTCELRREDQTLTSNDYDLTVHDDLKPNITKRLRSALTSFLIPK